MQNFRLLIIWLLMSKIVFSQCDVYNYVFQVGEKASYEVYYKLGFMWFNAAEVSFEIKQAQVNNKAAFHFYSVGKTLPNYDWLFMVRDTFQSKADITTLAPLWFLRNSSEGGYAVNNSYLFNYRKSKIYSKVENSKKPKFKDTLDIEGCPLDVLTAIYVCRNIDFKKLNLNDTVPLKIIIDNEIFPLYIRFLGSEDITLNNENRYNCVKFSILLVEGTIFKGGEDMTVWVTNDNARVPVKVEANILIGSVIVYLNKVRGLKWPITSLLKNEIQKN